MNQIANAIAFRNNPTDRDLTVAVEYARKLAASELLPKAYVGKPQNILLAVEYGRSLGLDPITAMQMTHVISGKPTASAQLVGALVRRAGHRLRVRGDAETATAKITRHDDDEFEFVSTWTMDRAKRAGLLANKTWQTFPEAMLKARAITEVARDACPEVMAGIGAYTAEELEGPVDVVIEQTLAPEFGITDDGDVVPAELVDEPTLLDEVAE